MPEPTETRLCHCGEQGWWVKDGRVRCNQCATWCKCDPAKVAEHDAAAEAEWNAAPLLAEVEKRLATVPGLRGDDVVTRDVRRAAARALFEAGLIASVPNVEWAVEITWVDPEKSGAKGPTSQYGEFEDQEHLASYLRTCRQDRAIAATRIMRRRAGYTPWEPTEEPQPTSEEERERLYREFMEEVYARNAVPATRDDS